MKLYACDGAINPDRVTHFLKEKGKLDALEIEQVVIMEGGHRSEAYRKVNPLSTVPSLQLDDGTVLTESRAICTYLEAQFPEPNLMGETALERAQIEMWDRRIEFMLMMSIAGWFRHGHPAAGHLEAKQIAEWSELNAKRVPKVADYFDSVLGKTPFVAGQRFTNADITLYLCMGFGRYMKFKAWEGRPNLEAWFRRMRERPMAQA